MATQKIVIIGAGGFSREVAWLIREINSSSSKDLYLFQGHVVTDPQSMTPEQRKDLLGDYHWLEKNRSQWDALVIGIGSPESRCAVPRELDAAFSGIHWPTLIHPSVKLDFDSAEIGRGSLICANVIGTVNLKLEEFCLINLACTIGHEAVIGTGSVLNPSVNISGGVSLGREVLVGTGAQVLQYLTIGERATIGAGAVVTKDVPPGITVTGVPAKDILKR